MKTAIVSCLHGDEAYGKEVIKRLPPHLYFFIANQRALKENKRFIDVDLNRCFPGKQDGNHEEKLAFSLKDKLKEFDYVLDLHSSSNNCPLFGIITKPNKEKIELAKKLGLKKLVIMPERIANNKALIDHVKCGISLEIGPHNKQKNIQEVIETINNFLEDKNYNPEIEIFEVFDIINKQAENPLIKNFQEIKKTQTIAIDQNFKQLAEQDFTSVLVNEKSYEKILCFAARRG